MKRLFLIGWLLIPVYVFSQKNRTRYVAWVTPVGNNYVTIDGLAVGVMALPNIDGHLRINGLNLELLPLAIFTLPGAMINTMVNVGTADGYAKESEGIRTEIHGVSISGGVFEDVEIHGVSFNLFNSYASISKGIEMSYVMNSNYIFTGVQLSGWGNRAVKGKGLQVGFFNSCDDCHVVQIGVLNRIGGRILPLINFRLKKKSIKQEPKSL